MTWEETGTERWPVLVSGRLKTACCQSIIGHLRLMTSGLRYRGLHRCDGDEHTASVHRMHRPVDRDAPAEEAR